MHESFGAGLHMCGDARIAFVRRGRRALQAICGGTHKHLARLGYRSLHARRATVSALEAGKPRIIAMLRFSRRIEMTD